ncbi:NAD-dependent epimerase/dehydratase family protein [Sanguibacter sp. 4.1]|uniref:NAD-dependent epimerase/dehydratase family protein n=1 Tax=Sanguibacter biliveldensis TaxID=3030830 RepID=A0AAF0Z545_9MICO|nr:NAD-dependent epimerase/dehydratase family protein [Sanguibacter sp. 4.1]WPF82239.1 NAD-dependent epimerase/dehydratase family protein [Sanguibacter sp. 4.1]
MSRLMVLFLGGTGVISSACARVALAAGHDLTIVTRGSDRPRPAPEGATTVVADVRDAASLEAALAGRSFDVVVDFIAYSPQDVAQDIRMFSGRVSQYVLVSTCSVYSHPAAVLPITEGAQRRAPRFEYPAQKIRCELAVEDAQREEGFPATIVRPSHVYDRTTLPLLAGWTAVERMRDGRPVVVHGDGTSLWNLMHADDFARAFVPLLGNPHAVGEAVHITSSELVTWDQVHETVARAAGASPVLVHRSSEDIGRVVDWMDVVLGEDFRHTVLYDRSKLARLVPGFAEEYTLARGMRETLTWFDEDPARRSVDAGLDAAFDTLASGGVADG